MSGRHVLSSTSIAGKVAVPWRRFPSRPMRSPSTGGVEDPFSAHFHLVRTGRHPGGLLVEGLRMSWNGGPDERQFSHLPVMVNEVVELFAPVPPGVVLDATVGGGGHAAAILERSPQLELVGLDQDPAAISAAETALAPFGGRVRIVRSRFDGLDAVLDGAGVGRLSGALFDLGVSSPQFDRPERGFSYRTEAPLDMRMDPGR
jgi:hypothetical protein